eukprot:CAMPEP_0172897918 /NCGR_PEP_ID=MMETSP1075-20121228/158547_1 /TAXON_ID=2916 /ORGANISM="Ceratium fusus, Strain PA161109" /LENGTH=55 /DNA_ID=CAMNT_0013753599 /DNA_START=556 /DNA_END=720 /DNA_ORIENTATION=-
MAMLCLPKPPFQCRNLSIAPALLLKQCGCHLNGRAAYPDVLHHASALTGGFPNNW